MASSSTAVNPKYCRIYGCPRWMIESRSFCQGGKEGSSFAFLQYTMRPIRSEDMFVRTCNNFWMRRILSCIFAVTYVVYICIGAIVIVSLIYFCSYLLYVCFCYWNEKCEEITRICKYIENSSLWVIRITASRWNCIKIILYYYYCYYYDI